LKPAARFAMHATRRFDFDVHIANEFQSVASDRPAAIPRSRLVHEERTQLFASDLRPPGRALRRAPTIEAKKARIRPGDSSVGDNVSASQRLGSATRFKQG